MKTNNPIKALLAALLLGTALSVAHAASIFLDGDFDSLPVGTAPDFDTPAGNWFWPPDYQGEEESAASQISIASAPASGTGNALRFSFTTTDALDRAVHLPNIFARSVTRDSLLT